MDRYKNAKIYKIVDNTTGKMYIGSTCEPTLAHRLAKHRRSYNRYLKGGCNLTTSFEILKNNNYSIFLLEEYPCETKDQLLARERFFIENNECVNKVIPTRTIKEWEEANKDKLKEYRTKYRQDNSVKIAEFQKKYREQNKEKIKEYKKQYYLDFVKSV